MAGARNRSEVNADADSVTRATITTAVSDHVRALIFDHRVLPGQRLVAEAIAEELGVSRVPVREALRQLDGSGLVEVRPRRGATVVSFDLSSNDDLLALLQVRRELESWAAAEAARRHRDDDIGPIDRALEAGAVAVSSADLASVGRAHHDLVQAVARASRNRHLLDAVTPLHNRTTVAFSLVANDTLPDGWPAHRRIRDAIVARDARSARRETRSHLDEVMRAVGHRRSVWRTDP